jgi:hypothetical protein
MSDTLYTAVQTMASKLHKKYKDNLKFSEMIDAMVSELGSVGDTELGSWSADLAPGGAMYTSFTSKVLPLPETIINGFGQHKIIDKNHFMMQVFRIPLNEKCTLSNILRIACYTGILGASMKADDFPEGIVRTFKALNLHAMVCYVDSENFNDLTTSIIKEKITQAMVDGNLNGN